MTIEQYISYIRKQCTTGVACGAPDYILQHKYSNIPVAFIEAKDLNKTDLAGRKANKCQFDRYKHSLDNIISTVYLDFQLYEKGEFVESICITEFKGDKIVPLKKNSTTSPWWYGHSTSAAINPPKNASKTAMAVGSRFRTTSNKAVTLTLGSTIRLGRRVS